MCSMQKKYYPVLCASRSALSFAGNDSSSHVPLRGRSGAGGRPSAPDRTRRRRCERGAAAAASAGSGVASSRGVRGCARATGAAGGQQPARRRRRIPKCLPTTAALKEAVPPPARLGESNPDPHWLLCQQEGPAGGSKRPSNARGRPARGAYHRVDIRGTHSSATCRSWCGDPGCRVDLLAADELNLKEVRRSRQKSSACWTQSVTHPPAQKSPANLGGGL